MNSKKTAAIHTLGCKVNSYESQSIEESLVNEGFEIVPFTESADVYIINTCTVTAVADKKSRQIIRRAKKVNPNAIVVACGCYVEKNAESLRDDCDIIIGNNKKSQMVPQILDYLKTKKKVLISDELFSKDTAFEKMQLSDSFEKTRAFIKVQDGCNAYCSYCIIPYVRGVSRSRKTEDILKEIKTVSKKGHSEIVLCAINLSDFKDGDKDLSDLVLEIEKIDSVKRIRMGSLEPDIFTKEFVEKISQSKKLCPHFHLSLQSACDVTLKNMRRRYDVTAFLEAVNNLRISFINPAICADVIAGFCAESEENFTETYENIKKAGLYELHVFPYSEREGTKAQHMDGKLDKGTKAKRAAKLIELSEKMAEDYRNSHIGLQLEVLFEEEITIGNDTYQTGFSKEYIRCAVKCDKDLSGKIVRVKAEENLDKDILRVSLQL